MATLRADLEARPLRRDDLLEVRALRPVRQSRPLLRARAGGGVRAASRTCRCGAFRALGCAGDLGGTELSCTAVPGL
eukprot:13700099-Alexandrium_andersonii.AAC.1